MERATTASDTVEGRLGYISDMLAQLADLAGGSGSERLERALRLLALEAAADRAACPAPSGTRPPRD